MAHCCVDVVVDGVSAVDHQTVHKLHGLGPLTPQLAGHNDLTTLGTALHDEPQNTIAGPEREEGKNSVNGQKLNSLQSISCSFLRTNYCLFFLLFTAKMAVSAWFKQNSEPCY